ncbi:GAF domain-containing protein, partial [bacterium]
MSIGDARNVDLSTCDREPIHIPGSIQPHGVLFALEEETMSVLQVSENVADFFGSKAADVLGRSIGELLSGSRERDLRAALPKLVAAEPILLMSFEHGGGELNVVGHRSDGVIVVELEPADPIATEGIPHDLHSIVAAFIAKVQGVPTVPELGKLVATEVRQVTGFDRVLVYRFDEDGTGIVVAEDRNEAFPSLQDHRFPASDVPKQARELYRLNRLRIIPNAGYRPSTIVPTANPVTGRPLDLSFSTLRSVSPIHVEYLKNMGTEASMSVSVLLEGQLWGLISCHHATPREVPFEARAACDLLAQVFSLQIASRARAADVERRVELKSSLTRLLAHMAEADDFTSGLLAYPGDLLEFAHAAGVAIVKEDTCHLIGRTPTVEEVRALA